MSATSSLGDSVSRPSGVKFLPSLGFLLVTGGLFLMDMESLSEEDTDAQHEFIGTLFLKELLWMGRRYCKPHQSSQHEGRRCMTQSFSANWSSRDAQFTIILTV